MSAPAKRMGNIAKPNLRRFSAIFLAVALAATGTVVAFAYTRQKQAARERLEAAQAGDLEHRVAQADASEWRAIALRGSREAIAGMGAARAQLVVAVRESKGLTPEGTLRRRAASYETALDREADLLQQGRFGLARRVDESRVDPAHRALHAVADKIARDQRDRADDSGRTADHLTWIAAAFAVLTLLLLIGQLIAQRQLLARERGYLEELRGLDRLKDEFIAAVSHELRTPLTSIRGYLELVLGGEGGELTETQREFLRVVDRNSDRLLRLVGDLLDVAQIESGRLRLNLVSGDLRQFVAEAIEAAQPAAADKAIELALDVDGDAPVRVDRTRLAQVIDNLVSNAVKFTEPGGRVDVRVFRPNGVAVVEVADTGMGIPAQDQPHLFRRFYRAPGASDNAIPGTGLGLWISKAIVEAHGGTIGFDSEAGTGTTFRIKLPTTQEQT